jgi:hypothetical protein
MTTCAAGHRTGSKPYIVPLAGNCDRAVPLYVVYHGWDYLNGDGKVVPHCERLTIESAQAAIARHEATLPQPCTCAAEDMGGPHMDHCKSTEDFGPVITTSWTAVQ